MPTLSFQVRGMRSRQCVRTISGRVSDVAGVLTVEVDLGAGTLRVTGTADVVAIQAAIASAGYEATATRTNAATRQPPDQQGTQAMTPAPFSRQSAVEPS